jgi:hypothetical protein
MYAFLTCAVSLAFVVFLSNSRFVSGKLFQPLFLSVVVSKIGSANRSIAAAVANDAVLPTSTNATVLPMGNGAKPTTTIVFSPYYHTTVQALGPSPPAAEMTPTDKNSSPYFHTTVSALAAQYTPPAKATTSYPEYQTAGFHTTVPALGPSQSTVSQSTPMSIETLTPFYHTTVQALGPTNKPAAQVTTTVPIAQPDPASDNRPSLNVGQAAGGSGDLSNSPSGHASKQSPEPKNPGQPPAQNGLPSPVVLGQTPKPSPEPENQGQPSAQSGLPSSVVSYYVAAGQTVRPVSSDAVELGGATIVQGAPAKTVGGQVVSLGTSYLAIGSSSIPLPTPAAANPSKTTMVYYVAAGETVIPYASNQVIVGGSTIIEGAQAQTVGGTKVSLGVSQLVIGSSTIPRPAPPSTAGFTPAGETVVPVASNEVLVGTATVTKGAAAKTIDGAKVSMGSSGLVIGNSTVPLPTAATSTASLGGLIMSGLGPGPSSSQTSSSSSTAIGAATGDGARVGRGGRLSWIVTLCTGSLLLLCQ